MSASHWDEVRQTLGLPPVPDELLQQALQHGSYVRELGLDPIQSNQRLEFLGDAVLDLIVAEELYRNNPQLHEGLLTKTKASAVRAGSLARMAVTMNLGAYLLLGHGEEDSGGRQKPSILADAVEALLGAIYLACGLEKTRAFLLPHLDLQLIYSDSGFQHFDHKTLLQELLQSHTKQLPTYVVVETSGPAHNLSFEVEARFGRLPIGRGTGASKRKAEQDAARVALETKERWLPAVVEDNHAAGPPAEPEP